MAHLAPGVLANGIDDAGAKITCEMDEVARAGEAGEGRATQGTKATVLCPNRCLNAAVADVELEHQCKYESRLGHKDERVVFIRKNLPEPREALSAHGPYEVLPWISNAGRDETDGETAVKTG